MTDEDILHSALIPHASWYGHMQVGRQELHRSSLQPKILPEKCPITPPNLD
uniref:Uncharacterized protein n=1 Tax=Arundo donax TaxID=35708 RepID=A0A0A8YW51_ARUDO